MLVSSFNPYDFFIHILNYKQLETGCICIHMIYNSQIILILVSSYVKGSDDRVDAPQ